MPLSELVLVLMLLLAVGMITAGLFRRLPIPYTVLLVVTGMGLSSLASIWPALEPLLDFDLTPELMLFIFLPTLIFESGFNLDARQLIKDIAPVMALAVPALIFSTAVVGLGIWLVLPIGLELALVFGALISATDPVAVIALFKELGTPQRLTVLVEGESLLNDATAIVLFTILLGMVGSQGLDVQTAVGAVLAFFKVFFGGILVGIVFGLGIGWLMGRLHAGTSGVLILSLVMAYISFVVAEHSLHLSGVMAVASAAVTLGFFGVPRLPRTSVRALGETWEFLAQICNTLLFILVGMSVNLVALLSRLDVILITVLLILGARASMIYTLVPSATRVFGLPRVTYGERLIMWWGGLKGGLAIAIALSIPPDIGERQLLLDLTLGVVLFTLLVNAPTIRPLIRRLRIDRLSDDERTDMQRALALARHHADRVLQRFTQTGLISRANRHQTGSLLDTALKSDESTEIGAEHRYRRLRLDALRVEQEVLEDLYKARIIPNYTFMDVRGELERTREQVLERNRRDEGLSQRQRNPFLRLEDALVRRLRERDWASGLLSRYQNLRMSQHLHKAIAHILMTETALEHIRAQPDMDPVQRAELEARSSERLGWFWDTVEQIRQEFPDFYHGFESRLALRATLVRAELEIEEQGRHGTLGAKPRKLLLERIHHALANIPRPATQAPVLEARDLIGMVPLLAGLGDEATRAITSRATQVHFLAGDTVIGEGEHGDALYIVAWGRVAISRYQRDCPDRPLGELGAGDFFGEMALLGEQVRTATVRATQASTLLRLTRKDILEMARRHPAIAARLQEAQNDRTGTGRDNS